ncbi:hypothetical protein [Paractinoplanes maris]|uniref:hypothetical protein n=1 Tax=Paractinoplanes maris TaxID=1734446 RepID=UPI002020E9CA|nr:hypothetical protein [Actinoplanes maris]
MATVISDELKWVAKQIVNECGYPSAVLSGLKPDSRHLGSGGFHCSVLDLRAHGNGNDYSNSRSNDRNFHVEFGAAADISMSAADMIRSHGRIRAVWADRSDPRRKYVNAINGWDGTGDAVRYDFDVGTSKYASPDHRWHVHLEVHRRYVRDPQAAQAVVSIFKGESKAAWIARASSPEEEDVAISADDWKKLETLIGATPQKVWEHNIGKATGTPSLTAQSALVTANLRAGSAANDQLPKLAVALGQLAGQRLDQGALVGALVPALTDALLARLPEDRDDVTADELKTAILAAVHDLVS